MARPRLLVSVRNAAEATVALQGGADLIDIKDPAHGALGAAVAQWPSVATAVRTQRPISAAMGELDDWTGRPLPEPPAGMVWWKFGLAGQAYNDWESIWSKIVRRIPAPIRPALVGYADGHRCAAPPLDEVVETACRLNCAVLIDTHFKDGSNLWKHVSFPQIRDYCLACHARNVPIALAGSLDAPSIPLAIETGCDWIAVRGAACSGHRNGPIDQAAVLGLKELINSQRVA